LSLNTGLWSKDGVTFVSGPGNVTLNDQVYLRHTASGSGTTQTNQTLTIGTVSDTFTSTTIAASGVVDLGINSSFMNNWGEDQPLANVFHQGRTTSGVAIAVDSKNQPTEDFGIYIYEGDAPGGGAGGGGGAQTGVHTGRFTGQATITGNIPIDSQSYDSGANQTTFQFTTTAAVTTSLSFANTKRLPADPPGTGITDVEIMRPGTTFGDYLNPLFVQGMQSFSHVRFGPNWDGFTYETGSTSWASRPKPDGLWDLDPNGEGQGGAWESCIKLCNELNIDLWVCLPANATSDYIQKFSQLILYGSNGVDPYTSVQASPEWPALNSNLAVYIELGNEIWNGTSPYGFISNEWQAIATTDFGLGLYDYGYASYTDADVLRHQMQGRKHVDMVNDIRAVVPDNLMNTRVRPVLMGQDGYAYRGLIALSYIMCVHGGHDWKTAFSGTWNENFPGRFNPDVPLLTPEDNTSTNTFGNVSRPISYWVYGYGVAPYLDGQSEVDLLASLSAAQARMQIQCFDIAQNEAGVVPMCYEGGINNTPLSNQKNFTDEFQYQPLYNLLDWWLNTKGGGPFANFALVGGAENWGQYPDHTRQDPATYPKIRACRQIAGLD
jgi:hypothetical protein